MGLQLSKSNKIHPDINSTYIKPTYHEIIGLTYEIARRKMKLENIILKIQYINNIKQTIDCKKEPNILFVSVECPDNYSINQSIIVEIQSYSEIKN